MVLLAKVVLIPCCPILLSGEIIGCYLPVGNSTFRGLYFKDYYVPHFLQSIVNILDIVTIVEIAFACSVQDCDQLSDTAQKEQFDHVPTSENSSFKFLFIRRMLVM